MIVLPEPCPVALTRLRKNACGFYCRSCKKNVVDFRGMTEQEIALKLTTKSCGIFDKKTVMVPSSSRTIKKRFIFYTLTIISIIGFNVSPASA